MTKPIEYYVLEEVSTYKYVQKIHMRPENFQGIHPREPHKDFRGIMFTSSLRAAKRFDSIQDAQNFAGYMAKVAQIKYVEQEFEVVYVRDLPEVIDTFKL